MEQAPKPTEAPKPKGKKMWVAVAAVVIVIIVVVAGLYYAGYLGQGTGTPVSIFENPKGTCSTSTNCSYSPNPKNVTTGTKVTWTNDGTIPHTVTACSSSYSPSGVECPTMNAAGLPAFDSGTGGLSGGQQFSYTFSTSGAYHYYCRFHNWMHGTVNVA